MGHEDPFTTNVYIQSSSIKLIELYTIFLMLWIGSWLFLFNLI